MPMRLSILPPLALVMSVTQVAPARATSADLGTTMPIAGNWTYAATPDGSEAQFTSAAGYPQLWVHCTRATRRVSFSRLSTGAAPLIDVWTSSATRTVASAFNPATGRLTIDFANYDSLLDAVATSRGRIGFSVGSGPALVVPAWADVARVVEDCRV